MSTTQTKPWSAVDGGDDLIEIDVEAAPRSGMKLSSWRGIAAGPNHARDPHVSMRWALLPMIAGLGWAVWGAASPGSGVAATSQFGTLSLLGVATLVIIVGWISHRQQMRRMAHVLSAGVKQDRNDRQTAEVIDSCPDLNVLGKALLVHLDRVSDALQNHHERGVELGRRLSSMQTRQLEDVLDSISDAIVVLDAHRRVKFVNEPAKRLFADEGFVGRAPTVGQSCGHEGCEDLIKQAVVAPLHSVRTQDISAAERTLQVSLTRLPANSSDGGPESEASNSIVVMMLRDVTRQKEMSKVTTSFVSHVAHELRTPLSSLKAYVEMLVDGEANDEASRNEYYNIIQVETDRMARLIDNILNISRIESGLVKVTREPTALAMVVREVVEVMKPQAELKQITLRDELVPVMHQVRADRDMIYEAVMNLVSNAIKYTQPGGKVGVRMTIDEAHRTITTSITDTGVGIPEEDLPRMFEKFFRVKANKKVASGTGLGLNLVRQIVEVVHGGKVGLDSKVGEGSTFTITLPLL